MSATIPKNRMALPQDGIHTSAYAAADPISSGFSVDGIAIANDFAMLSANELHADASSTIDRAPASPSTDRRASSTTPPSDQTPTDPSTQQTPRPLGAHRRRRSG